MSSDSPARTQPADALAATLKRTEVQHHGSSIPGRDIVQVLTEIPVVSPRVGTSIPEKRSATSLPAPCRWRSGISPL
jgi:hypothetical protein